MFNVLNINNNNNIYEILKVFNIYIYIKHKLFSPCDTISAQSEEDVVT